MTASPTIVIAHIPECEICPTYHVIGDGALVFVVDDNHPGDRVYEITTRDPASKFRELIPLAAVVGHCRDTKHAEVVAQIKEYLEGGDL